MTVFNIVLFSLATILSILLLADSSYLYSYGGEISVTPTASPLPTATPTPMPKPVRLVIPKLAVDTHIEHVGMDEEGKMDVPAVDTNVAWFSLGYKPGEKGNSVIAGHYDTQGGNPSVFYNLSTLVEGDEVFVIDELGQQKKFIVRGVADYDVEHVPLDTIFGNTDQSRLNLVTCSGFFNSELQEYSHRTVVFTEME